MIRKWTDRIPSEIHERLCECRNLKKDIKPMMEARWAEMVEAGKDKEGFTREDALVYILEWMDWNNQWFDLTREEYNALIEG